MRMINRRIVQHFRAADSAGQHQVANQDADVLNAIQQGDGFFHGLCFEGDIAQLMQLFAQRLAHIGFIFQQQHQFVL